MKKEDKKNRNEKEEKTGKEGRNMKKGGGNKGEETNKKVEYGSFATGGRVGREGGEKEGEGKRVRETARLDNEDRKNDNWQT